MHEPASELSATETRRIGSFPWNRLQAESSGRGWRNVHASVATVTTWAGAFDPGRHSCLAYCVSQPAFLHRRLEDGTEAQTTLRPRQFFVIPGNRRSEWDRRGRTEMLMIYIRQELLDAVADEFGSVGRNGRPVDIELPLGAADPFLEQFALQVLGMLGAQEDGTSALYMDALSRAAAMHLVRRHRPAGRGAEVPSRSAGAPHALARVRSLIEEDLGGDLSLEVLARAAGLPVGAFGRSFRAAFGTSPHQYVLARRLDRARTLLIATDTPIGVIALDTGFASQSHLTTAFKRHCGVAPAAFRRAV